MSVTLGRMGTFLRKFFQNKHAAVGLILFTLEVLAVIVIPMLWNLDPTVTDPLAFNAAPGGVHLLGTDEVGRDIFARVVYGGRMSLFVGVTSTLIGILIGLPLGLFSGYYRGVWENAVMRCADVSMSFPSMILVLVLVAVFGQSILTVTVVIGVLNWTQFAKLVHGNVLAVRSKEYIEAAKADGMGDLTIIFSEILPNVLAPVWISMAFTTAYGILTESALSFLGVGVQPPAASWGNIIYAAQSPMVLTMRPWIWLPAGICLFVTVASINLLGEGIRDALDPKTGA
ncbi:Glutathione transport system permease protein GsiD [bioreactor metagenome]|uniref:Glutathione transport system permease protein GsiD n=1 Tax=bioreactor metagenome TaxID=1076179 RepID=A0A644YUP1_9ZZZZ